MVANLDALQETEVKTVIQKKKIFNKGFSQKAADLTRFNKAIIMV